jgi:DNA-binding NtrC family response regulator
MSKDHVVIIEDDAGVRELLETWLAIEDVQVTPPQMALTPGAYLNVLTRRPI